MDELTQLLDRAVASPLAATCTPPAYAVISRARRRSVRRTVASVTLVAAMTVGGVIGLASAGRASETTSNVAVATAVAAR